VTFGRSRRYGDSIVFAFLHGGVFAELKSAVGNELSTSGPMLFMRRDQSGPA
jgi:hypothetical protein